MLTRRTLFAQASLGTATIVASAGLTALPVVAKGRGNDLKLRRWRDRRRDRKERRRDRRRK
jgi:hypothetical protein